MHKAPTDERAACTRLRNTRKSTITEICVLSEASLWAYL